MCAETVSRHRLRQPTRERPVDESAPIWPGPTLPSAWRGPADADEAAAWFGLAGAELFVGAVCRILTEADVAGRDRLAWVLLHPRTHPKTRMALLERARPDDIAAFGAVLVARAAAQLQPRRPGAARTVADRLVGICGPDLVLDLPASCLVALVGYQRAQTLLDAHVDGDLREVFTSLFADWDGTVGELIDACAGITRNGV